MRTGGGSRESLLYHYQDRPFVYCETTDRYIKSDSLLRLSLSLLLLMVGVLEGLKFGEEGNGGLADGASTTCRCIIPVVGACFAMQCALFTIGFYRIGYAVVQQKVILGRAPRKPSGRSIREEKGEVGAAGHRLRRPD